MNKKAAQAMRRGYREAGKIHWTQEMVDIIKGKQRELIAYRVGMWASLAFAVFVSYLYARAVW